MRAIVIAVVVLVLVGAAGHVWQRGGEVDPGASGQQADGATVAEGVAYEDDRALEAVPSEDDGGTDVREETAAPAGSTYYQWVDERGSVHFAASLHDVPADWRSRVGQIALDDAAFTQTASPAAKPARPRPAGEVATSAPGHDVTVYTAPWCGWCRKTLAFLDKRGVDYVNKDIESDASYADELREKTGGTAIPLVEIDGSQIRGFDPGEMASLLD